MKQCSSIHTIHAHNKNRNQKKTKHARRENDIEQPEMPLEPAIKRHKRENKRHAPLIAQHEEDRPSSLGRLAGCSLLEVETLDRLLVAIMDMLRLAAMVLLSILFALMMSTFILVVGTVAIRPSALLADLSAEGDRPEEAVR